MDPAERLARLWEHSEFRRSIHLNGAERAELLSIGIEAAADRSRPLIESRLGPAQPVNDGRQTPWHGFLTFPAQHATATCCRACLLKHHGVPVGVPLDPRNLDYILSCLRVFWEAEMVEQRDCQCRRCLRASGGGARQARTSARAGAPGSGPGSGAAADRSLSFDEAPEAADTGPAVPDQEPVTTGYSDIDLRRWKDYSDIETGSLWLFGSRDRSGGHRLDYHGNFIPQIATQTFQRFTRRDEIVLDLFLGSGTSAIEACRLGRRCIGVELREDCIESVRTKLAQPIAGERVALLKGDSRSEAAIDQVREQLRRWGEEHAHLAVLHPPYHDIIPFSEDPEDLSNAASTEEFVSKFRDVARNARSLLAPGRFAVLVIGDKYSRGELVPLGFLCMQAMNEAGFRTRSIVVKNIEGNEVAKGQNNNLWRYRALRGGFYIFKHEYVIIFQAGRG